MQRCHTRKKRRNHSSPQASSGGRQARSRLLEGWAGWPTLPLAVARQQEGDSPLSAIMNKTAAETAGCSRRSSAPSIVSSAGILNVLQAADTNNASAATGEFNDGNMLPKFIGSLSSLVQIISANSNLVTANTASVNHLMFLIQC